MSLCWDQLSVCFAVMIMIFDYFICVVVVLRTLLE